MREARASGRSVPVDDGGAPSYVAVALAGTEHLGTLVLHGLQAELGLADRRTLERGALVTALVLLFARSVAEAEDRVRGELLGDLLEGRDLDGSRLRERARRQHADLDGPTVVVVARVDAGERRRSGQVASRLGGELAGLAGEYEGRIVLVVPQTDDPLRIWAGAARPAGSRREPRPPWGWHPRRRMPRSARHTSRRAGAWMLW